MTQPAQLPHTYRIDYFSEGSYQQGGPYADLEAAKAAARRASTKHIHAYVIISQGEKHVRHIHFKHGKEQGQ